MLDQIERQVAKLKPPWLSWLAGAALAFQCFVAGLFIYAIIGNLVGLIEPGPGAAPHSPGSILGGLGFATACLAAAIGIYFNRWWAYFLEFALLWTLILLAVFVYPVGPTRRRTAWPELPGMNTIDTIFEWSSFAVFNWHLLKRGISGFRDSISDATHSPLP